MAKKTFMKKRLHKSYKIKMIDKKFADIPIKFYESPKIIDVYILTFVQPNCQQCEMKIEYQAEKLSNYFSCFRIIFIS